MNTLRLLLACAWTAAWGSARYIRAAAAWQNGQPLVRWRDACCWSRRESPKPMRCDACGWMGPLCWAHHTYVMAGGDDVEPIDVCPVCCQQDTLRAVRWGTWWTS